MTTDQRKEPKSKTDRCHYNIEYATLSFSAKPLAKLMKKPCLTVSVWLVKSL